MKKLLLFTFAFFGLTTFSQTTNYVMKYNGFSANDDIGTSVATGVRSIEFWFKPDVNMSPSTNAPGWGLITRNDNSQFSEYGMYIRGTDWNGYGNIGNLSFWVRYSGSLHEIFSNQNTWTAGTWYHIAGVIDPSTGMKLYVNGVLQTSTDAGATSPIMADNLNPTYLGSWGSSWRFFEGRLDELRLWNRALSQNEIQTKMCQNLTPANETGLQGYYKLDEGSGSQIFDLTANSFNGTVNGSTWIADSPCPTQTNYVMHYNGPNTNDNIGTSAGNGVRSIEFWFKPDVTMDVNTTSPGWGLITRNDNFQTSEYGVYIRGTDWNGYGYIGNLCFWVRYSGTLHEIKSNQSSWTAGTWYHIAGVIDPVNGMKLYVNGVLQSNNDAAATSPVMTDNTNPTYLGSWGSSWRFFEGRMDELRLWNRALSQNEIQTKMCQNLTPANETGLQAYYKFDEGSGSQIIDQTANVYTGSVNGTNWLVDTYCSGCTPPTVNINGVTSICSGSSTTLGATGSATSYTWSANAGSASTATVNVSPTTTTTYTLLSSDASSCVGTNVITVYVNSTPTLSVSGSTSICSGNSTILYASGASSYTWNTGTNTYYGQNIYLAPGSNSTYTLTGANGNCVSTQTVLITVSPSPTINIAGNTSICSGSSIVLSGSGSTTYTWSSNAGSVNTSSVNVNPTYSTTYTLTGSNGNCTSQNTISVFVTSTPTLSVTGASNSICSGAGTTLSASGAGSYTLNTGSIIVSAQSIGVNPTTTTSYTLSGSNGSCASSTVVTVNVLAAPVITINAPMICIGNTGTLTATGAGSYTWSPTPQFSNSNGSTVLDNPNQTTTYTVTGIGGTGCLGTATVTLQVDSCLNSINVALTDNLISVYPNPNNGILTVDIGKKITDAISYFITNEIAQIVYVGKLTEKINKLDLTGLADGVYFIRMDLNNKIIHKKIILQR